MRTRRSRRNQEILYRSLGAQLARAASVSRAPAGYEADPQVFACPDGPYCNDPACMAENARREREARP